VHPPPVPRVVPSRPGLLTGTLWLSGEQRQVSRMAQALAITLEWVITVPFGEEVEPDVY
jgi:hypothetical protein